MMSLKKISFAVMFSALALTQSVGAATIVPVPSPVPATVTSPDGPVSGEFQGMVTSVTSGFVSINNDVLQVTGDAVITYNGGLTSLAVGQIVNYSYATDVDGVKIATTIDAYPTQATSGTARVYGLGVNNATGGVQLYLSYGGAWATYTGPAVEYFQPYAFISGIGTNTSFGVQLVNYVGFINPTTGRIFATSGYMSDIPVTFKPTLPNAVVGQVYTKQSTMELGIYGAGDVYTVTATGLPEGLVMTNGIYDQKGVISGVPTTPGTYVATLTAICGQYCVAPYTVVGQSTVTIIVTPDVVAPASTTPVSFVSSLVNGQVATAYTATNLIATGVAPFSVVASGVPLGMSVSATGVLSGTPAYAGTYTLALTATSVEGVTGTTSLTFVVNAAPVIPVGTTLANGTVGVAYPAVSLASPGVSLFMVSNTPVTGIPAGMTVSTAGILSGTPTTAGTYEIGFFAIGSGLVLLGEATTTITIDPAAVVVPPVVTCSGVDQIITNAVNVRGSILEIGGGPSNGGIAIQIAQNSTTIVPPLTVSTFFAAGNLISYTGTMSAANLCVATSATISAPVVVIPADTTAPIITMNGTDVTLTEGTSYVDAGATCTDNVDATCTVTTTSTVDTTTAGTYTVTYSATDVADNIATPVVRTVTVTPVPVVTCSGVDQIITNAVNVRGSILEIGGGPSNGGIAIQIAQNSTTIVPPLTVSTFFAAGNLISYTGTMSAANLCVATSATISAPVVVIPADTTAPVITMNGTDATFVAGTSYVDAGATCTDNVDATCTVTTTSTVDTTTAGTYTVTYSTTDVAGNIATPVVRTVTVNAVVVTPPTSTYTSTGKKVEGTKQIITTISVDTITVGTKILRITPTTVVKTSYGKALKVGDKIEYKGILNTDGSVTLTSVKTQ